MKKVVALVLAVMLALSFAACGGEEAVNTDGPITITWYVPGEKQDDISTVMEAVNKISEKEIGVKLDVQYLDSAAYTQRMNLNFASASDEFDLCFTGYINPYRDTVVKGAYLALDDYIEKSDKIKEVIPEYARNTSRVNGKIYALPNMQIMATKSTALLVQEDLAEEYGLKTEEIKSLNDIEPFLAWAKEKHPELYGFRTGAMNGGVEGKEYYDDSPAAYVTVVKESDGSFKTITPVDDEYFMGEIELLRDWFEKGYIRPDIASVTDDSSEQAAGKYAAWRAVYTPGGATDHNLNNPNNRAVAISISDAFMPYDAGSTAMTAINANSKHPDEAFKVMELVNTNADVINILAFGVENKHYNLDENGKVVLIENSGYKSGGGWKFGSVFNTYTSPGQPDTMWEDTIAFNEEAIKSSLMGFSFNNESVKTEIAQILTVAGKYKQVSKGYEAVEQWYPKYKQELKDAGIEKVAAEVLKQVNEWAENNK